MPRQVGNDLRQHHQTDVEVVSIPSRRGRIRKPRYTEQVSLTADRDRPYANNYVRDDITWEKIHYSVVYHENTDRKVRYFDLWESTDGGGVTRQGGVEGSTERAYYPIPCLKVVYNDNENGGQHDGQQTVHSHVYEKDGVTILRIEIPSTIDIWADQP
jgi:hypothetical protein